MGCIQHDAVVNVSNADVTSYGYDGRLDDDIHTRYKVQAQQSDGAQCAERDRQTFCNADGTKADRKGLMKRHER